MNTWILRFMLFGIVTSFAAAMSVTLVPSIESPAPVGTMVSWTANTSEADSGTLWYRFRTRRFGEDFRTVRDYGPLETLEWTAIESEGDYEIEVSVRNRDTGETAVTSAMYRMTSRALAAAPVINPTANPLVFLYSAPPCPSGSQMRVQFQSPDGFLQNTPYKPCREGLSMNFYVAGMKPNTRYSIKHTVDSGSALSDGPALELSTPDVPSPVDSYTVVQPPRQPIANEVLLQGLIGGTAVATDLYGNLLWFYLGEISSLTRVEQGGYFMGVGQRPGFDQSYQIVRKFDLAGMTVLETNAARVNEQLAAMGMNAINGFHHEARTLPDGRLLVLAGTERIMTDVQGPGAVDVLGDMILVLDRDLNVVWAWDAFDHMDPSRAAVLGETCTTGGGGCPPIYLAERANDWLHGNSLQRSPDGNILYSARHMDWLIKIDYQDGRGSGQVLWRLGKDGDFQILSNDPWPWFSHQHDAQFEFADSSILRVFDNGNTRYESDPSASSRGQVLQVDEQNRVVRHVLNADLGAYSFALGTAQKLAGGNYNFNLGLLPDRTSQSVEVDPSGQTVYAIKIGAPVYRSFRLRDLYTPWQAQK